ncbi:putative F-box protein At5g62660 [Lotus japonicus]|uniref:putative F-box protein At5g62660 n=1 Tax=Lotus japonicus TaxID=34305 RepID=UPI0025833135|nr:putative F-box protein At5g62660 [Lotus japonicus]
MKTLTKPADLVHVPSELVIEILMWLPVKTLMRFKCVCKLWKSLTKDKDFVKLHLKRSPKNKHVLFILRKATSAHRFADFIAAVSAYGPADIIFISRPMRPLFEDPSSMIDDGGCLSSEAMSVVVGLCNGLVCFLSHRVCTTVFQLWNPATGLWSESSPIVGIHAIIAGFGFGYDDSSDTYKEAYKSFSLPEGTSAMSQDETPTDLGILGNCLCLFQNYKKTDFVVWQMREYGVRESWTRLLSVSYEHLQCDGYVRHVSFMCLCEDDDILMLLKYRGFDAIMYNARDNSVKHVQLPNNKRRWLNIYGYVESLVSPY